MLDLIPHTPHSFIHLRNILHVPSASKNFVSTDQFALDINALVEFNLFFFLIKDQAMKKILFRGAYHRGLYPIVPIFMRPSKHVFVTIKPSSFRWHHHLGHPSLFTFNKFLEKR